MANPSVFAQRLMLVFLHHLLVPTAPADRFAFVVMRQQWERR
ncbi:hypothetical protein [Nocardia aurea]|uniref:Uncharacterized protein n=1 Tax=Nocardia aurea TaxID=2144174 RepID=A0ABV3FYT5_9NOCA